MINMKRVKSVLAFIFLILMVVAAVDVVSAQEVSIKIDRIITTDFPTVQTLVSLYDQNYLQVSGINRDNFLLFEDDQPIENFAFLEEINYETPLAISILIDTTGSMVEGDPSPLQNVVVAVKSFVENLQPHDSVGIISFGEQITIEQELTTEKSVVFDALDRLEGMGDTPLYDALYQGIDMVKSSDKKSLVILITDGVESGRSSFSLEDTLDNAIKSRVPVYPIGFGPAIISPEGNIAFASNLDEIAAATGGFEQIFLDSSNMELSLNRINHFVRRNYRITYVSNLPAIDTEYQLMVELNLAGITYTDSGTFVPNPIRLEILSPQQGSLLSVKSPIIVEALSSSEISQVQILINEEEIEILNNPTQEGGIYEIDWDLLDVEPGEYEIKVVAVDVIGNQKQSSIPVRVREPIRIVFVNPEDGDQLISIPQIEVMIDSVEEIESATLFLNENVLATFTDINYTQEWPTHSFERGIYRLSVSVTDKIGNIASEEINVRIGRPPAGADLLREDGPIDTESSSNLSLLLIVFGGGALFLTLLLIFIPAIVKKRRVKRQKSNQTKKVTAGNPSPGPSAEKPRLSGQANNVQQTEPSIYLQEINGISPGSLWTLEKLETRFGRKKDDNDIQLQGAIASRRMAIVRRIGDAFILHPLHPENPVFINNQPITQQVMLNVGDNIRMGESVFVVVEKPNTI